MKTVLKIDEMGGSKTIKIMLNYEVYCLGFGRLQLSNCCFEDLKTWSNCNIGLEGIALERMSIYSSHCQIPGDPLCGLHILYIRKCLGELNFR